MSVCFLLPLFLPPDDIILSLVCQTFYQIYILLHEMGVKVSIWILTFSLLPAIIVFGFATSVNCSQLLYVELCF